MPSTVPQITTIAAAQAFLHNHHMTIRRTLGEYRVAFNSYTYAAFRGVTLPAARDWCESTSYYSTDLQDAVDTAVAMSDSGAFWHA